MDETLYKILPSSATGLTSQELEIVNLLLAVWQRKLSRNLLRERYYEMHNKLKDLKISIPPQLSKTQEVIGWAEKAVDKLAARSVLKGFTCQGNTNPELDEIMEANDMDSLYMQVDTSMLVHSCAFMTVSRGLSGEPESLITSVSATTGSAVWDWRKKRIKYGLAVIDVRETVDGRTVPTWVDVFLDNYTLTLRANEANRWIVERADNPLGRPLMEPFVYRPSINRPFGKSRISRAVMSLTDNAVRCALRTEVAAEFFTSPQKYLLGADKNTFANGDADKIAAYLGAIFAVTPNKNGDIPQFGQLSQMSMQPHTDYMMSLAKQFAGETGIPVGQLGIVQDNPASAEAIYASTTDLIIEAETLNKRNGRSLRNVAKMALAAKRGCRIEELDETETSVKAVFENPQRPSMQARSDFAIKLASVCPEYAKTEYFWRDVGYADDDAAQMVTRLDQLEAKARISSLFAPKANQKEEGTIEDDE